MDTEDGGWTLVWSYGFKDYNNFWTGGNYVEPIPSAGWTTGNHQVVVVGIGWDIEKMHMIDANMDLEIKDVRNIKVTESIFYG